MDMYYSRLDVKIWMRLVLKLAEEHIYMYVGKSTKAKKITIRRGKSNAHKHKQDRNARHGRRVKTIARHVMKQVLVKLGV